MLYEIDESQRQIICLSLARTVQLYPGWDMALGEIADILVQSPEPEPMLGHVLPDTRRPGREIYEHLKALYRQS